MSDALALATNVRCDRCHTVDWVGSQFGIVTNEHEDCRLARVMARNRTGRIHASLARLEPRSRLDGSPPLYGIRG